MGGAGGTAGPNTEQSTGSKDKTYYDIVVEQFRKNKLAMWGLRIVTFLILVAIFAPFLANPRPIVFHGYRYQSYVQSYDQLAYAHADLFGVGRSPDEKLVLPGLYDEGVFLPGLGQGYQKEVQAWDAGQQTWKQIRNASFGDANELMNSVRKRLEDEVEDLIKDMAWARGARKLEWIKKQQIPSDLSEDLDELVAMARKNLDTAYKAKAERRRDAAVQQFKQMAAEVNAADGAKIEAYAERYRAVVNQGGFHKRPPADLAEFDALLVEVREQLAPAKATFESHTDFPALRQLEWLDILFMLLAFMAFTHRLWGRWVPHDQPQELLTRKGWILVLTPILLAGVWHLSVPAFNDTLDYERGMKDGSLYCDFRVMAPIRHGVNENDTSAKYLSPWWSDWASDLWKRGSSPRRLKASERSTFLVGNEGKAQEKANDAVAEKGTAKVKLDPQLQRDLDRLDARISSLQRGKEDQEGTWSASLDFLNQHHMGTDSTGRDLMTRMIWGSRISLSIGFVAVAIYLTIGLIVGALAGFFGGWVDMVVSRAIEIMICFPTFFLILTVIAFVGPSIMNIMIVIGLTGWPGVARLVRGEFLRLRKKDFVVAGKALGYSDARIIFRHVLPNALAPVLVAATFGVARAILVESSLSFLGFGVTVPTPTWGSILSAARESYIYWWITFFPGFAIFLTVTMYNLVGEGIRDAVDPKLRQ